MIINDLHEKGFLPEPLVQFNPEFATSKPLVELVGEKKIQKLFMR